MRMPIVNKVSRMSFGNPSQVARMRYQDDDVTISISAEPCAGDPDELPSLRLIGCICRTLKENDVSHRVFLRTRHRSGLQEPERVIISKAVASRAFVLHPFLPPEILEDL